MLGPPRRFAAVFLLVLLTPGMHARAAEPDDSPDPASSPSPSVPATVGNALLDEARRYACDGAALVTNPLHWKTEDFERFAAFAASLGILIATDEDTYRAIQERRSATTDDISKATTDFGGPYAWGISGALIAGGLLTKNPEMRDTGRDALEAAAFAGLLTNIFKPVFGRERPEQSDGKTIFHGFNNNYKSFPSGHATTAFAVASVIAMRTDGWIVPTVAYTLATIVAFDRVNDQAHFVGDVFAGAAIGVSVGRFIVGRHEREAEARAALHVEILPIRDGIGARLTF
jgi:hypothetical protein